MSEDIKCPSCGDLLDINWTLNKCPKCDASLKGVIPKKPKESKQKSFNLNLILASGISFLVLILGITAITVVGLKGGIPTAIVVILSVCIFISIRKGDWKIF